MYVVRRPFRTNGTMYAVGTVIDDPTAIKHFKNKLAEGRIVKVTDANKDYYAKYFQLKFGVDILQGSRDSAEDTVKDATNESKHIAEAQTVKAVKAVKAKATK